MKLICYSLFAHPSADVFEKRAYVRGFYWNCRMNNFIYPTWRTHLEVDAITYQQYQDLFDWLKNNNNLSLQVNPHAPKLCEGMFWRMKPLFMMDVSHILCRDADSITTYREAQCVQQWLESTKCVHAIHDNRSHDGLMGGMMGFDAAWLKGCMEVTSWDQLVSGFDLSVRGSDQHLLNQKFLPKIKDSILWHGGRLGEPIPDVYSEAALAGVDKKFWESNLTCRHIGSPGVVEMETIRFFRRFDEYEWKFQQIEKQFPNLFNFF